MPTGNRPAHHSGVNTAGERHGVRGLLRRRRLVAADRPRRESAGDDHGHGDGVAERALEAVAV